MYLKIDTHNVSTIFIHIPAENAATALPAISQLFERNAVFVESSWNSIKIVHPERTIHLGDKETLEQSGVELAIVPEGKADILGDTFKFADNEILASNFKELKDVNDKYNKLREENSYQRNEISRQSDIITELRERVEKLSAITAMPM